MEFLYIFVIAMAVHNAKSECIPPLNQRASKTKYRKVNDKPSKIPQED